MNRLLKKEIRLLLPVWLAVLMLEVALPWIGHDPGESIITSPVFFFFGIVLLAVDPFGREFSLGTFSSLMAQPVNRRQIWRTKISVLLLGAILIYAAFVGSCELRLHHWFTEQNAPSGRDFQVQFFRYVSPAGGAALFVALAGGLWTTLLLRQISAAFWITFLVPAGMVATATLALPEKFSNQGHCVEIMLYVLAASYTLGGFWLAHWLFHRAQDVAWTGGVISFSNWRYFNAGAQSSVSRRQRRPMVALLKKEFQLHSISLFCVGTLLVLHLAIFFMRIWYIAAHKNSLAEGVSDTFWTLWLIVPLIIGGTAVAEERKLGRMDSQFCLPVSRRMQFLVKFVPILIFGTLLGGVMPMLLESLAAACGVPSENFRLRHRDPGQFGGSELLSFELGVVMLAAGFSWVSFFASTLARNFLQALSLSIVFIVACCLLGASSDYWGSLHSSGFGILPWPSPLPILLGLPTLVVTLMWMLYANFNWFQEGGRLWRRHFRGMLTALLFVFVTSAVLYNRVWEIFLPAEPPHGPARWSRNNPPILRGDFNTGFQVCLPDGRVWVDHLGYPFLWDKQINQWKRLGHFLLNPWPSSLGPRQFVAGSNWVAVSTEHVNPRDYPAEMDGFADGVSYLDTVGVKADGTLWISRRAVSNAWTGSEMQRCGSENNWRKAVRQSSGLFLLLKNDGTLWRWGTNQLDWSQWRSQWPTVRALQPQQVGTNSDWQDICNHAYANARKTDGSSWTIPIDLRNGVDKFERRSDCDQIPFHNFSRGLENISAFVRADGALWVSNQHFRKDGQGWEGNGYLQIGKEPNWAAVAVTWPSLVALKTDGSLWKWKPMQTSTAEFDQSPPAPLGIHRDWLGLISVLDGAVSLAADGSLWLWPNSQPFGGANALKAPKQPQFLGNVFADVN